MPMAIVEYGLTVVEHKAVARRLLALPHPQCPNCEAACWSKGLVYRKRAGVYVRQSRCSTSGCRTVVTLLPAWMAVRIAATLDQIENVIESRESGATWRVCADRAGLSHRPSTYRRWFRCFDAVMTAVLPSVECLILSNEGGWVEQLRLVLDVTGAGVLMKLRWRLFDHDGAVLGPLRIFAHGRVRPSKVHSP